MELETIVERMEQLGLKQRDLAAAIGIDRDKVSKTFSGVRQWRGTELSRVVQWLDQMEKRGGYVEQADQPEVDPNMAYVSVEVLPTYAGAGGGGTGDDDRQTALVSRALVEGELRGRPSDFVLVPIKGDSMEPDFFHGDQVLCDRRDRSPAQPGPFALWDGEWGEYVMKNVERLEGGRVRMFSSNPKYSPTEIVHDETRIIGRPVWFGRRC